MAVDSTVALISLVDARAFLSITAVNATLDAILESLINQASVFVTTYVGRKFLSASYTEFYDGQGKDLLILNNFPVSAISSIHDDPDRAFGANTLVSASDYVLDSGAGIVRLYRGKPSFLDGLGNVRVAYTAGYLLAAIPHDIQMATRLIVADVYQVRVQNKRYRVGSETIADRTVQFTETSIPAEAKTILDKHRQMLSFARGFS